MQELKNSAEFNSSKAVQVDYQNNLSLMMLIREGPSCV
jgi:hypothetical protein